MSSIKINGKTITPWIVGELKWVRIGTKMPAGWVKVDMNQGDTIVSGTNEGTTKGEAQKTNWTQKVSWRSINDTGGQWNGNTIYGTKGQNYSISVQLHIGESVRYVSEDTQYNVDNTTPNQASGIYAELWEYKGEQK